MPNFMNKNRGQSYMYVMKFTMYMRPPLIYFMILSQFLGNHNVKPLQ